MCAIVVAAVLGLAESWDGVTLLIVIDLVLVAVLAAEHVRVERPFRDDAATPVEVG